MQSKTKWNRITFKSNLNTRIVQLNQINLRRLFIQTLFAMFIQKNHSEIGKKNILQNLKILVWDPIIFFWQLLRLRKDDFYFW